jgi:hypothetical protein
LTASALCGQWQCADVTARERDTIAHGDIVAIGHLVDEFMRVGQLNGLSTATSARINAF